MNQYCCIVKRSVVLMLTLACLLFLPVAAHGAGQAWYCPQGRFSVSGDLKQFGSGSSAIYVGPAGGQAQLTGYYNLNDGNLSTLNSSDDWTAGDPDKNASGTKVWGTFQSPPVNWTVSGGSVSPSTGTSTTWTLPNGGGSYSVSMGVRDALGTANDHADYGTVASIVARVVSVSSPVLWWFGGETGDSNWPTTSSVSESGAPGPGYFKWVVSAGSDKVDLQKGTQTGDTIQPYSVTNPPASGDTSVTVIATGASGSLNDVTVEFWFGTTSGNLQKVAEGKLTVRTPHHLVPKPGDIVIPEGDPYVPAGIYPGSTHDGGPGSWISYIRYNLIDNMGELVKAVDYPYVTSPRRIPQHEYWPFTSFDFNLNGDPQVTMKSANRDYTGSNWPVATFSQPHYDGSLTEQPTAVGGGSNMPTWPHYQDQVSAGPIGGMIPAYAVPPSVPHLEEDCSCPGNAVDHWNGYFYFGSQTLGRGVRVSSQTWQRYQDHALHTGFASPAN